VLLDGKTGSPGLSDGSPAWVEVDLGAADPATVISQLQLALFFPDLDSAANAIPTQFRDLVPYRLNPSDPSKPSVNPQPNNQWFLVEGSWRKLLIDPPRVSYPKVLHFEEPEYTEQARQLKVQGSVFLAITVSDTGNVANIWLLKPFGYGMEKQAALAAAKTTFMPPQVDGKPAVMSLIYDVNFQIIQ
jgi:TonB family protein